MNIVLLEPIGISEKSLNYFAEKLKISRHQFTAYHDRTETENEIIKRAKEAEIIIIANLPLSARIIESCQRLKMISVAFTGIDHIDMESCHKKILPCVMHQVMPIRQWRRLFLVSLLP